MIRLLSASNCFSFANGVELDLRVNQHAPQTARYQQSVIKDYRIAKLSCIVGANGSGKTNLLRIINYIKWFLLHSFSAPPDDSNSIPFSPFLLWDRKDEPSQIKIEFESKKVVYRYEVVTIGNTVQKEQLEYFDSSIPHERQKFTTLFTREKDDNGELHFSRSDPAFALGQGLQDLVKNRSNASVISAGILSGHPLSLKLKAYWDNVLTNIKTFGTWEAPIEAQVINSAKFYNDHADFFRVAKEVLAKCDLGLDDLELVKVTQPSSGKTGDKPSEFFIPFGKHKGPKGQFRLSFNLESSGTHRLFTLFSSILPVLSAGGIAAVDELEADLHPNLLPALIDLFVSPESNPCGAQLIFTCHATPLLSVLDKYQIVIVAKDQNGISEAWRLDEIEGVRNTDNFFAKYTAGAYGGIPEVSEFSFPKHGAKQCS